MKSRYSTVDIKAVLLEIREQFSGLRVANIYDVDNKTYLLKFTKPGSKKVLLIESGTRIHITEYDWPKSNFPSGFSMKLRKHLKSRRLETVCQLGNDRIVQMQFGSGDAAYHVILELYDRGNIILTDCQLTILNILRPRADNAQDVKFAVREIYPVDLAKSAQPPPSLESLHEFLISAKPNDNLRKILNPKLSYGPAVIEHCLQEAGFPPSAAVGKGFDISCDLPRLFAALEFGEELMRRGEGHCQGYIIQKVEQKAKIDEDAENSELLVYDEFHPFLYKQHLERRYLQFDSFNQAVDQFFSQLEAQKIEMKTIQAERSALKKLDNVRRDHTKRLQDLQYGQQTDEKKAHLIQINLDMVDKALSVVRSALANQIDWADIIDIVKEAQSHGDPVAMAIKSLKLEKNHFTMLLRDHYDEETTKPVPIDIDIALSAYANAKKYYDQRRHASHKEQKTIDASGKALKSAERRTKQVLKEMKVTASIVKARKVMWFEKFNWFISSENFLVIAGRDGQQNELLVRRYLRAGDVYVHADIHGATSIVIKNPQGGPIPPKTLNEAGSMSICHSAAWDAKVVTSAWWVYHHQVSKTAPSGEYLTTGSFMIRGKKNFLPPSYLIYGFGLLFKLDEDSVERHRGERKVKVLDDDLASVTTETDTQEGDVELDIDSGDSDEELDKPQDVGDRLETLEEVEVEEDELKATDSDRIRDPSPPEDTDIPVLDNCSIPTAVKSDSQEQTTPVEKEQTTLVEKEQTTTDVEKEQTTTDIVSEEPTLNPSLPEEITPLDREDVDDDEEEEDESAFPDTQINLQHVSGSKFELRQRSISQVSSISDSVREADEEDEMSVKGSGTSKPALSRKQRRDMKKVKKQGSLQPQGNVGTNNTEEDLNGAKESELSYPPRPKPTIKADQSQTKPEVESDTTSQPQGKRGQSGKLKKIKKKYADQDEEEREIRLSLLQSAERETKKRAKLKIQKKQQEEKQIRKAELQQKQQQYKKKQQDAAKAAMKAGVDLPLPADEEDALEEVDNSVNETGVLDTLTGLPTEEDSLLYAIPFCAPYSVLQNFKYKVKLIPGSTKRGKAVKAALNAFLHDKSITQREKDLVKSLKDVDMSRNIPSKVKVTSSQVHKNKSKR